MTNQKTEKEESPENLKRINGKYIWMEMRSVLNFDKGILYTIKELFLRPGNTISEFLLFDRKRIVKPIIFVIFSSLIFEISKKIFEFNTGSAPQNIDSAGIMKVFKWVGENFGFVNILGGFLIGFWLKLFFIKSKFNIYEIFILVFYTIGISNIIYTFFGILESVTGFQNQNLSYYTVLLYSVWAMGNFFNKNKILSYLKGLLAYILGGITGFSIMVGIGILIDLSNKSS